jgi:hypothetical protein
MNRAFRAVLTVLLALLSTVALAADPVFPPGSRVGIVPPPGMTQSGRLQGFEDSARGAVLRVSEFTSQTHARIAMELSPEMMQRHGIEEIAREHVAVAGGQGLLVGGRQTVDGVASRRYMLLVLANDITAVAVVSVPETAQAAYPDAVLRAALMTLVVRAKLSPDELIAVLPYRLTELSGFRLMRATGDGAAAMTLGPADTSLPVEQPYFIVALSRGDPPAAEHGRIAQRWLLTFSGRPDLRIVSSEPVRIGGEPGHQIIAESKDDRTGDPLTMVQWLRFGSTIVHMFGIAKTSDWADAFPRMRAVRDGFERK